jgi:hypothetical protein
VITVAVNAVTIGTITPLTTGGVISMAFTATTTATAALSVGTSDVSVTFTVGTTSGVTGTLAGVFVVEYLARNSDGSTTAYASGYTNN